MKNRRVMELIRKERRLEREIRRKKEQHAELVAQATSTGSFRYDQEKVTRSSPDGSRQERIVIEYVMLEEEIEKAEAERKKAERKIRILIGRLPERERNLMRDRLIEHHEVETIMQQTGITYDTYRQRYHRAISRMEETFDICHKS